MVALHDPSRQLNYLRQALSEDKRPLGLLLGAGCPVSVPSPDGNGPLIPAISGVTERVCSELGTNESHGEHFRQVVDQLARDGNGTPNIEDILSHIRALRLAAGSDEVRGGLREGDLRALDDEVCKAVVELMAVSLPGSGTPYHRLGAWISAADRSCPVEVFTTNYDLLIEQALEQGRTPYFDGFVGSHRPFFDPHAVEDDKLPPRWARVWKLHGSIDWYSDTAGLSRGAPAPGASYVIHPSHLKYDQSRRMPYLALADRLRGFLKQPGAVLVACGCSFGDEHVNDALGQGLAANPAAAAFGLLHGDLEAYPKAAILARARPNLTLLARDSGVVGTTAGRWQYRQDAAVGDLSPFVESVRPEGAGAEQPAEVRFSLGDFAVLGEFLARLMGRGVWGEEAGDVI